MIEIARRAVLAAAAALVAAPALAQTGSGPAQPIARLNEGLLAIMQAGDTTPFAQREQMLAPAVDAAFDLSTVLESAVGLRWRSMPPNEQAQLLAAFREFTIASYVANFDHYSGERFEVLPETRRLGTEEVVSTQITHPNGGDPTRIDYVMRPEGGTWKVVDVLLDGSISRAAVLRSDFRSLLSGGSAAPLVENLNRKSADLAGGNAQR